MYSGKVGDGGKADDGGKDDDGRKGDDGGKNDGEKGTSLCIFWNIIFTTILFLLFFVNLLSPCLLSNAYPLLLTNFLPTLFQIHSLLLKGHIDYITLPLSCSYNMYIQYSKLTPTRGYSAGNLRVSVCFPQVPYMSPARQYYNSRG